ncbi:g7034 [Coccomyxa viridis]|uniref:G7034 protein n=1 Tax=Coccomyxa viridis TaxID=1274662 RepID=A0ABP1FWU2_9CHLO
MPAPQRSAWVRHHQQNTGGGVRLFHIQLACACMLLLFLVGLGMRARLLHDWASHGFADEDEYSSSEHFLSLIGLGPAPSGSTKALTLANLSLRLTMGPSGQPSPAEVPEPVPGELRSLPSPTLPPPKGQSKKGKPHEAYIFDLKSDRFAQELEAAVNEPPGKLPRLNATVQQPLGEYDPEHSPLCAAFRQPGVRKVAVVGNGPLNDAQRKEIDSFDVVVRFNLMNNWRRFKEKLTIWVIRFSTEARMKYWGLTNLSAVDARNVVGLLKALWLVGGRQKDADELLWKVPGVVNAGAVLVPQEPFAAAYSQEMGIKDGAPSTGFVGIRGVLHCTPEDTPIHIFGFNWHNSTWRGHKMDAEKAFVDWAVGEGRLVVHPTTCYGVRECGGNSTFDQSCHWGTDGRYVCLRGTPRRWVDLTDTLAPGRFQEFMGQVSSPDIDKQH